MASHPKSNSSNFNHDIKRLDQHFLAATTADHVVGLATIRADDVILDIGAGTGNLTAAILKRTSARVVAIEADPRCLPYLEQLQHDHPNLVIKLDRIQRIAQREIADTTMIIANPPFSALEHLTRLLRCLPDLKHATLCVGRRWADATTAPLGSADCGLTSIAVQSRFDASTLGLISGTEFTPPIRRPAAILGITRRRMPDPALDLLADTALNQAGTRVKDFLRSRHLRRALGTARHRAMLHDNNLRRIQQRRISALADDQLSELAQLLRSGP